MELLMSNRIEMYAAIKIQALWRGYASRKGILTPCCCCGFPMTLKPPQYPETMSAVFFSVAPCSWCAEDAAYAAWINDDVPSSDEEVKSEPYPSDEERYIPCCMCGANCADDDFEKWRICSRRCLVAGNRW